MLYKILAKKCFLTRMYRTNRPSLARYKLLPPLCPRCIGQVEFKFSFHSFLAFIYLVEDDNSVNEIVPIFLFLSQYSCACYGEEA